MDRGTILGAAALVVAGAALAAALGARGGGPREGAEGVEALRAEVGLLAGRLEASRKAAEEAGAAAARAGERAAGLGARLDGLVEAVAGLREGRGAGGGAGPRGPGEPPGGGPAAGARKVDPADPAARKEFRDLRRRYFEGEASAEEQQRFWDLAKAPGFLDALLADQEAVVAKAPGDLEARMVLGDDYVAKLFTVPPGPEMGVWGSKAEGQWLEVLKADENHWQARFNVAFSWSQWPDFLNKTPDAIREFENLRGRQESATPEARHAQTYLQLHVLHKKAGNPGKAREALDEGLRRFPSDPELRKLRDSLEK
jgi:hypothetical protein